MLVQAVLRALVPLPRLLPRLPLEPFDRLDVLDGERPRPEPLLPALEGLDPERFLAKGRLAGTA